MTTHEINILLDCETAGLIHNTRTTQSPSLTHYNNLHFSEIKMLLGQYKFSKSKFCVYFYSSKCGETIIDKIYSQIGGW